MRGWESIARRAPAALAVAVLLVLPALGQATSPSELRARSSDLASRERAALLELYALDSRLERAHIDLAAVQGRIAALDRERSSARRILATAHRTLVIAQGRLAEQLRLVYVSDELDPLAVLLGATTIEDAIDGLDSLDRTAIATSAVVDEARAAQDRVTRLQRSLGERRQALRRLRAQAAARAAALVGAKSERLAYIGRLRAERQLTERQIADAEAAAQAAEVAAREEAVKAKVAGTLPSLASTDQPSPASSPAASNQQAPITRSGWTIVVLATAYSLNGSTSTGIPVGPGIVAVDPTVIPLGTRMTIPGYGEGVAADTGGSIRGNRIDVWVPTKRAAHAFGWQTLTVTLH